MTTRASTLRWIASWGLALGLALAGTTVAGETEEVRLYTNADLERFPALPDSRVEAERLDEAEWNRLVGYIEREHARIDADRAYELERNRSEAEVELIERRARRSGAYLPYNYRFGFARIGGPKDHRFDRRISLPSSGGEIRPLHAGPTRAQIDHSRATRRSGADAYPSRPRPANRESRRRPQPAPLR